jgi:thymidine phosphorylase
MTDEEDPPLFVHARRLGVDTGQEAVIFLREDSDIARAEGFRAHSRVELSTATQSILATVHTVSNQALSRGWGGLSEAAWRRLEAREDESLRVRHPPPVDSLAHVRAKIYGRELDEAQYARIMQDIAQGRYMDVHLAAFITGCAQQGVSAAEMVAMTRAMVSAGQRLDWGGRRVMDKHCVGGLPGNRTTPIVVAIVAAAGLLIPKTSSRAITSPAGTADTMETLAPVELTLAQMHAVAERTGGCVVWGGSVSLSPADDVLVQVERSLDIDSEGQLVASVLSKKLAAGATDVVIDMPVGLTAKVRDAAQAASLSRALQATGEAVGLAVRVVETDGSAPVGRGIGPALEARDVLAVLQNAPGAPADLAARAVALAGVLLETGGAAAPGLGETRAAALLAGGEAWQRFQQICEAQGGMRTPPVASHTREILAERDGRLQAMDNRELARVAKLAGAPVDRAAGLLLQVRPGDQVSRGQPLFTIHAHTPGQLAYACEYWRARRDMFTIEEGLPA